MLKWIYFFLILKQKNMKFCLINHDYHPLSYKQENITINSISLSSDIITQKFQEFLTT